MDYKPYSPTRKLFSKLPLSTRTLTLVSLGSLSTILLIVMWSTSPFKSASNINTTNLEIQLALPPKATSTTPLARQSTTRHSAHLIVKSGDTLASLFKKLNMPSTTASTLLALSNTKALNKLNPNSEINIELNDDKALEKLEYPIDFKTTLIITKKDTDYLAKIVKLPIETKLQFARNTIDSSLIIAGTEAKLPTQIIYQLMELFAWDIDFAKDLRTGDHFSVLYESHYKSGKLIKTGEILAANFTTRNTPYYAILYKDQHDHINYYNEKGKSLQRAFIRTPVKFTHISSRFNAKRHHPILHVVRKHTGVDYAAPTGTPIKTTGNGKIIFQGRKGGYGKTIVIQHGKTYSTLYGHLSRYSKHLTVGSPVKQGDIIGYVGKTGLATAPHLHYEFRINGIHKNPVSVILPQAGSVAHTEKDAFLKAANTYILKLDL